MLYGKNLGYKGNIEKDLAERNPKALELVHNVEGQSSRKPPAS